jgi:uncharacterized protein (DUF427 family)
VDGDGQVVVVTVEALFNGEVIARSDRTVVVEGNHYFPLDDVRTEYLSRSWAKSLCPWKGIASYHTVAVNGARDRNAAWTYRHPSPLARNIKNHVAFWHRVQVRSVD